MLRRQCQNSTLQTSSLNVGLNIRQEYMLILFNLISVPTWVVMLVEPFALRCTQSHKVGIVVASWYQNVTKLRACKKKYAVKACQGMNVTCSSHARHRVHFIQDMMTYISRSDNCKWYNMYLKHTTYKVELIRSVGQSHQPESSLAGSYFWNRLVIWFG